MSDSDEINVIDESEIVVKPKRGRPKKASTITAKKSKKERVIVAPVDVEDEIIDLHLSQMGKDDRRNQLKKLYLNNKECLKHINLKDIARLSDEEVERELQTSRMVVNNEISSTLANQMLSLTSNITSWIFNIDNGVQPFSEYVLQDDVLKKTTSNILNEDILGYISHRAQFVMLYASKIFEYSKTSDSMKQIADLKDKQKRIDAILKRDFKAPIVKEQEQIQEAVNQRASRDDHLCDISPNAFSHETIIIQ